MRVKLQLVICDDQGQQETVTDIITFNKNHQHIEQLGLTLAEAKHLLSTLQRHLLHKQVNAFLDSCSMCPDCGTPLKVKAYTSRSFRTLFGTFKLDSPRLELCPCMPRKTSSFRPLSALLTESVAPELLYMEAKWSSLVSYGISLKALKDFLPLDLALDIKTVRYTYCISPFDSDCLTRLYMPLSTLHTRPYGRAHMTRGRCDWLGLHRTTLAFATPHRFIPALLPLLHKGVQR